jgi:CRP/FNR family cyclic AMP-dependent transcriptional regulator
MNGKLWYLKRCPLFEQLSAEQARRLDQRAVLHTFKRHAFVYAPTEPGQAVMVLARGRIKIKDITAEGKETILAFIEEGEVFGELALLDGEPRQDYAEAAEDSEVLLLPRGELLWLMSQRPDVALSVTKLIGLRRRRIENRLRNVLFLPSRERMVRLLVELVESHGERRGNRGDIRLPLSHQELASLIGVTRETATIVLGQLQADGLIEVHRRRIGVTDWERLLVETQGASAGAACERPAPAKTPQV